MENASHKRTPAPTHLIVSKDENGVSVDQSFYKSMIGSLLYLTTSRPDIAFVVGVCARYQAEPKVSHLNQLKRILKYVNGTSDYGMTYTHGSGSMLTGYCDADWTGSVDDRKSTSGGCFFLGNNLISWFSKKPNCMSLSTAEAEYIAAGSSCSQLVWMKQMPTEYNVTQDVMTLYCDNLSAINISKNPIQHSRTNHTDIRHHFIRELVEEKIIALEHVTTEMQLADIFTKALNANQFECLRGKLGICNSSDNPTSKDDMHHTDRVIRNLVTRILNEGHSVKGVSTPLSRRYPSPEVEPHNEKDDDSSRSEKDIAAEGLCSLGQTLPFLF
ncbi:hypothetical protein KIW84_024615 [Lathyrus oleraceus]|uniref:Gag-pol polyprotein n=1 Tax=Pisum sativum TaxID=3888 RepID=A0A9D5B7Y3_PEA|nr:hypothetical protein KIW84_024615 [Pisum sativum]